MKSINPRRIISRGGDARSAFEELTFLLFTKQYRQYGLPVRRHGAGGDAGLEGTICDGDFKVVYGIQSKFYEENLASTQWRDMSDSVKTAIKDNCASGSLKEVVIAIPRNLTQSQDLKWNDLKSTWNDFAEEKGYNSPITFTLWDESKILSFLLQPENRGLALYFFEYPDFDKSTCIRKTLNNIKSLGDRYSPELHTQTESEDLIHTFLKSERFRLQYVDIARKCLDDILEDDNVKDDWDSSTIDSHQKVTDSIKAIVSHLSGKLNLPKNLSLLASSIRESERLHTDLLSRLLGLFHEKYSSDVHPDDNYSTTNKPLSESYSKFSKQAGNLRSLAYFLEEHSSADNQFLIITGEPGRGKTHVLAEVCSKYADQGGLTIFLEGIKFNSGILPWHQVMQFLDYPQSTIRDFLANISAIVDSTDLSGLICIDALNETPDRRLWREGLDGFAAELANYPNIKLIVSCRDDYLRQTLPSNLAKMSADGWSYGIHHGLGINVFDAVPKYFSAFNIKGFSFPPLTNEFKSPLFLRIFCEAYSGQSPPTGSLSLPKILKHYLERKAHSISQKTDCEINHVKRALVEIGERMIQVENLRISTNSAEEVCLKYYNVPESSRSLYRALLSENILAEYLEDDDEAIIPSEFVRFTYERVWDYFLSLHLLPPESTSPKRILKGILTDEDWRWENPGVVGILAVRLPEEFNIEIFDIVPQTYGLISDIIQAFEASLSWRNTSSMTSKASLMFNRICKSNPHYDRFSMLISYSVNINHPWNALWLHEQLNVEPLHQRDSSWTIWLNGILLRTHGSHPLREIHKWATMADLSRFTEKQLLLLGTILAWCLSTTVSNWRDKFTAALTRILAGRTFVAALLLEKFIDVNDPYIKERVLLACAGSAQHARSDDLALQNLAQLVIDRIFSKPEIESHLLIRHYASEICIQAEKKGQLPPHPDRRLFRPPWKSVLPNIWSSKKVRAKEKATKDHAWALFNSVKPGPGFGYGAWGRYVMEGLVRKFHSNKLTERFSTKDGNEFDQWIAMRYVIQRVFGLGWKPHQQDTPPDSGHFSSDYDRAERLSKKYQWIALYEFLGFLSDHHHFTGYEDEPQPFSSAKQIGVSHLLDPYVIEQPPADLEPYWQFTQTPADWWRGNVDFFPNPLSYEDQCYFASSIDLVDPRLFIDLKDDQSDWFTLSAYHRWREPQTILESGHSSRKISVNWSVKSYLVLPEYEATLRSRLNRRFVYDSTFFLQEPEYGQDLEMLRSFPQDHQQLENDCQLDNWRETERWKTRAFSTTCQCAPDHEKNRVKDGSMPSPQFARLANLMWKGSSFDFIRPGTDEILARHVGKGFEGASIVKKRILLELLEKSGLRIVWHCFGEKQLSNHHVGPPKARDYWAVAALDKDGNLKMEGGTLSLSKPSTIEPFPLATPK